MCKCSPILSLDECPLRIYTLAIGTEVSTHSYCMHILFLHRLSPISSCTSLVAWSRQSGRLCMTWLKCSSTVLTTGNWKLQQCMLVAVQQMINEHIKKTMLGTTMSCMQHDNSKYDSLSITSCSYMYIYNRYIIRLLVYLQMGVFLSCSCVLWKSSQIWCHNDLWTNIAQLSIHGDETPASWEIYSWAREDVAWEKDSCYYTFSKVIWKQY